MTAAALAIVPVAASPSTAASRPAPSAAVRAASSELLVRFRAGTPATRSAAANRAAGGATVKTLSVVDGLQLVRVTGPRDRAVARYQANPDVVYATPNQVWSIDDADSGASVDATPNDPSFLSQWALENTGQTGGVTDADIDAATSWNATRGSRSVVVGLVDTGVQLDHPDLQANIWSNTAECSGTPGVDDDSNGYVDDCHGIDTINGDSDPSDDFGHGVHTAGTIGAVGNNGVGVTGVNWKVSILPCKSHDADGLATAASVIECLQYVHAIKQRGENIVATSNSYGGCTEACGFDPALRDAIAAQLDDGTLFVASAGNDNANNDTAPQFPASYYLPNVLSVEATTDHDARASFSNYGLRSVHIGAPGQSVLSTYLHGSYASLSGTSMAAPHVAGLAALLKAQDQTRDWRALRNLILTGGDPVVGLAGKTVTGRRLNAANAVNCTDRKLFGVLRPLPSVAAQSDNVIAAFNVKCADPAPVKLNVTITPGGTQLRLKDNGLGADLAAADGIFSVRWRPPAVASNTTYTLTFSNGQTTTVVVHP
jgi:subtilisin family serine protease